MTTSPGWYKDPAEPSTQRYWDGEGWVGAPLPADAIAPAGPPAPLPEPPVVSLEREPEAAQVPTVAPRILVPVQPHGFELASPSSRIVARLIDIFVVALLNAVVNGWFIYRFMADFVPYIRQVFTAAMAGRTDEIPVPPQMNSLLIVISLLAAALWLAYEVPLTADSGQTLGKRLARIKVVRVESQEPLGVLRSLRRWNPIGLPLVMLSCCGPFFVAFQIYDVIFVATDRMQRMALHDRSAATYVVKLPRRKGK